MQQEEEVEYCEITIVFLLLPGYINTSRYDAGSYNVKNLEGGTIHGIKSSLTSQDNGCRELVLFEHLPLINRRQLETNRCLQIGLNIWLAVPVFNCSSLMYLFWAEHC